MCALWTLRYLDMFLMDLLPNPVSRDSSRVFRHEQDFVTQLLFSDKKFKEAEKEKLNKKNLGGVGPRGFKSRSMQSFQEAMERGEAQHLLPVMNAKERIKKGELKPEDIPCKSLRVVVSFLSMISTHAHTFCSHCYRHATWRGMGQLGREGSQEKGVAQI